LRIEEEKRQQAIRQLNQNYFQATKSQVSNEKEEIRKLVAEQKRIEAMKKPPKKGVKIGERKLGPGFLERYGKPEGTA